MKTIAAIASLAAALMFAGAASGTTTFGITDDTGKYADDGGAGFFSTLNDLGLNENRLTVLWDPANPTTITDQAFLDRSVPQAVARGVDLVFDIYPSKARGLVDTPNGVQLFAQFAAEVAQRYPQVTRIICLNEGNQTRFQQPQYDAAGNGVAGALQESAMAACYDALKGVNPNIDVIGFGFSPRGNDDPSAASNVSHSPVRLLAEIGAAYRASGRALPIADDVALHCYPNQNTDSPSVGYAWPNVGCANVDRFKQAWWDAFHATGQPVFQETGARSAAGLSSFVRLVIDEVGYQVKIATDELSRYTGSENVTTVDDATQADYYAKLIAMMACDPNIALFNIFHLVDETSLPGWQSGLELADGSHRPSYASVKDAVAANHQCQGPTHGWRHTMSVAGAHADFGGPGHSFVVTAAEGFAYTATIKRGSKTVSSMTGTGRAGANVRFRPGKLKHGTYTERVELSAETNPDRVSTFVKHFHK